MFLHINIVHTVMYRPPVKDKSTGAAPQPSPVLCPPLTADERLSAVHIEKMFEDALTEIERVATEHMPLEPFMPGQSFHGQGTPLRLRCYAIDWSVDEQQPDGSWKCVSWGKTNPVRVKSRIASCSLALKRERS